MNWRDAVLASLRRYCDRHGTRLILRESLLDDELGSIVDAAQSKGKTPGQTLSRVLQGLRDEGLVEFLKSGHYLLLEQPVDVDREDLPDDAIDAALKVDRLQLRDIETADQQIVARRRKGQDRIRALILSAYGSQCAVCDIAESRMLVASHIVGWAESPAHRGMLANVLCLCRIHDALFEGGYWSLGDDLEILRRNAVRSEMIGLILGRTERFREPTEFCPKPEFLRIHRTRFGFAA